MSGTSDGTLLGGKVSYRQLLGGHRSGFEPVLLAAAVPARPGDLVLDLGTGAGAALLCLCARLRGVAGIGLELDPALAALANHNFRANNFAASSVSGDACAPPFGAVFDHVLSNPPWHNAAGTASPDRQRAAAHHAPPGLLPAWIAGCARVLKPPGSLSLILSAGGAAAAIAALAGNGFGAVTIFPLWPRAGRPAGQVILQAKRGAGATRQLPGLVLHDEDGITQAAENVLRHGQPLPLSP